MKGDRLYVNGRIYPMAGDNKFVPCMAIRDGIIIAVGRNLNKDDDFRKFDRIDLKNKVVLPGFHDGHTHIMYAALSAEMVNLDGLHDMANVLGAIAAYAKKLGPKEWIEGIGFSPDRLAEYVMPDRFMLDKVTGGRPAAIFSKDQHLMWVNSRALELAGYNSSTPDPVGGVIERLADGKPSGILKEHPAYNPIYKLASKQNRSRRLKAYLNYLPYIYSKGVTSVTSMDGTEAFDNFVELSAHGKLGLRVHHYVAPEIIRELTKMRLKRELSGEYYRVCGVKIFSDGALGSQSALCFNKYIGSKNNFGVQTNAPKDVLRIIKDAARLGLPAAIHAIGDRAISNVLECYEQVAALKKPLRHRIEHLQMIRRKDVGRVKKLGVIASMQPSHCPSDVKLIERYWGPRGRNCYIFKTLLDKKIPLAFGSDVPIEPLDPLAGIDAAVNRFIPGTGKSFHSEQRISIYEAVAGFTSGPAYAVGREYELGRLLPGYRGDFVVLDEDIFKIPRKNIRDINIEATILHGAVVYLRKGSRIAI
jgi:predicted amidohydrolase YtcJ